MIGLLNKCKNIKITKNDPDEINNFQLRLHKNISTQLDSRSSYWL